ncbi:TetR/AcrR family transcriptional regulator [Micromonospora sp. NPDC020750]|uniref:TetR/AcrR family transcriptional regulator n=1 Tax=unclassified Micromonospora TaxID=2617518 RepID=UPI00379AADD5
MASDQTPHTRNTERTRRAVLDATARALATHGGGVTLVSIAEEAGVSKGGLLHHYPTRNVLLLAVATDVLERFRAEVMRFLDLSENHPGKVLRAYVRALCGGSAEAMNFFAYSGLWNSVHMVPGVTEAAQADAEQWADAFAQDGLHPDCVLVVQYAAEGMAAAAHYDPSITADRLAHARELLIALTNRNAP